MAAPSTRHIEPLLRRLASEVIAEGSGFSLTVFYDPVTLEVPRCSWINTTGFPFEAQLWRYGVESRFVVSASSGEADMDPGWFLEADSGPNLTVRLI